MKIFDFLSEYPKLFIFKKESNKTNFGGILFLIYIILMIIISLVYILDYALNEKYSIENFSVFNFTGDDNVEFSLNDDIELNPYLDINITFIDVFVDNYVTVHTNTNNGANIKEFLEKKYFIQNGFPIYYYELKEKVNLTDFTISFKCGDDRNCTEFKEFISYYGYFYMPIGFFNFFYPGMINHNEEPPIQKIEGKSNYFISRVTPPSELGIKICNYDWEVIKYKDRRTLVDSLTKNKREYYSGHVKNEQKSSEVLVKFDNYMNYILYNESVGYFIDFLRVAFNNKHQEYLLYKRTKRQFMDVIASIGALFSTIKFFFSLAFSFYSKNFDNYEIIGNILNPPKEKKEINIHSSKSKKDENNNLINEINNLDKLIEDDLDKNKNLLNNKEYKINNDYGFNEENIPDYSDNSLKKLHFYDFFYNNIYSKCCGKNKNQELINNANEIIYKYLSIDSLLYNQIKLENLFKDYKWNDPALNDIKNNRMIINLKNT